jgi:ribose transport system permease protein
VSTDTVPAPAGASVRRLSLIRNAPAGVTVVALLLMFILCIILQPAVASIFGLYLVTSLMVPLVIAALAQMVMMSIGDIDLSIGAFIGLATTVAATWLTTSPALGLLVFAALVAGYGILGALVHIRKVPSLIATLGASFIWLGLANFVLPTPGGAAPGWLLGLAAWSPPFFPAPFLPIVLVTLAVWWVTRKSRIGVSLRALGSNQVALDRAGSRPLLTRVTAYCLVAVLGVLAGVALTSQIGGGDPTSADSYTLTSIAAVILGGGSFRGGKAVAWGTMAGALTLGLVSVLLSFLNLSSNVQSAIQGGIVIAALAGRLVVERVFKR